MRNVDLKEIYNTYLRISRKKQNKPYKLRNNWDGFEQSVFYLSLLKLKNFFDRNTVVNIEDFLTAPYEVYEESAFYDLDFYNTLSAVKVYNIYINKKNNLDPDHDLQIEYILRGCKFIKNFCIVKKIQLGEYLNYKEPGAITNSFIVHLKEKNISIYNLFSFKGFDKILSGIDYKNLKFILNDFASKISIYRSKYLNSKKGKIISQKGLKIIEKEISEKLA